LAILAIVWAVSHSSSQTGVRLARIERKLDAIVDHLGIDFQERVDPKVLELARAGKKIEAIKLYRRQSDAGLKEAKDYVESL
jgi:ribosomal protein L7/L12